MIVRLGLHCHNVCNQPPPLSSYESMRLPGSSLSSLLCSSKWALQCKPTLVWGFIVKPNSVYSTLRPMPPANSLYKQARAHRWIQACVYVYTQSPHAKKKRQNFQHTQTLNDSAMCRPQQIKAASQLWHRLCPTGTCSR